MKIVGIEGPWPEDKPCAWGAAVIEKGEYLLNGASGYFGPARDVNPDVITMLNAAVEIPDVNVVTDPVCVMALRTSISSAESLLAEASKGIDGLIPFSTPLYRGFVVIGNKALDQLRTELVVIIMRALTASVRMKPADRHTYIRIGLTLNPRDARIRDQLLC